MSFKVLAVQKYYSDVKNHEILEDERHRGIAGILTNIVAVGLCNNS